MDFNEQLDKIIEAATNAKLALADEHEGNFKTHVRQVTYVAMDLLDNVEMM